MYSEGKKEVKKKKGKKWEREKGGYRGLRSNGCESMQVTEINEICT